MSATTGTLTALVTADSRRAIKRDPGGRRAGPSEFPAVTAELPESAVPIPVRIKTMEDFAEGPRTGSEDEAGASFPGDTTLSDGAPYLYVTGAAEILLVLAGGRTTGNGTGLRRSDDFAESTSCKPWSIEA